MTSAEELADVVKPLRAGARRWLAQAPASAPDRAQLNLRVAAARTPATGTSSCSTAATAGGAGSCGGAA